MAFHEHRWVCPQCRSNNMLQSPTCFRCQAPGPTAAPPPAAPVVPLAPAPSPIPSPGKRRAARPVMAVAAAALVVAIGAAISVKAWWPSQEPTPNPKLSSGRRFRVHISDMRGWEPETGLPYIRCPSCNGAGKDLRDGGIGTNADCLTCGGSGKEKARSWEQIATVFDSDPTDYRPISQQEEAMLAAQRRAGQAARRQQGINW